MCAHKSSGDMSNNLKLCETSQLPKQTIQKNPLTYSIKASVKMWTNTRQSLAKYSSTFASRSRMLQFKSCPSIKWIIILLLQTAKPNLKDCTTFEQQGHMSYLGAVYARNPVSGEHHIIFGHLFFFSDITS